MKISPFKMARPITRTEDIVGYRADLPLARPVGRQLNGEPQTVIVNNYYAAEPKRGGLAGLLASMGLAFVLLNNPLTLILFLAVGFILFVALPVQYIEVCFVHAWWAGVAVVSGIFILAGLRAFCLVRSSRIFRAVILMTWAMAISNYASQNYRHGTITDHLGKTVHSVTQPSINVNVNAK